MTSSSVLGVRITTSSCMRQRLIDRASGARRAEIPLTPNHARTGVASLRRVAECCYRCVKGGGDP